MSDEGASSSKSMPNWSFTNSNPRIPKAMLNRDVIDEESARIPNVMLNKDVINDSVLNWDALDMCVRSRMHAHHGSTSMPEEVATDGKSHTLPSVASSQEGASSASRARAIDAILNRDAIDMYDSWKKAPENLQQLPTLSSSVAMTESGDHHDNVKERKPFASLPMLEQHQIRLEDGTIRTYFALPRDSDTESQVRHGKITSPYGLLSFPQLTQEGIAATNLRKRLRPHSELGEAIDVVSRKHGILHIEDDLQEKRPLELERADHAQFERKVQRELEDSSHAIEDANWACGERSGCSALPLKSHGCVREGAHFHNPRDDSALHGNEHAAIEELSEHVCMAFMNYAKILNEFPEERTKLEKQGKGGTLLCLTCKRFSKPYTDTHGLVMHTFMSRKRGLRAEHLGLRKAICTVMGWSTTSEPSIGKSYQHITSEEAKMNKEDLILWPPALVIHNALARECSDFQARDAAELAVKDLFKVFAEAGLSTSGIEVVVGNIGSLLVEYSASSSCLLEAERLHLHLAATGCGRDAWLHKSATGHQESTPKDRRILYGYLACAHDLDLVDRDFRRRCRVLSRKKVPSVGFVV